jgi:hypothetical protein
VVVNDFHDLIFSVYTLGTISEQTTSPSHRVSLPQLRTSLDIVDSGGVFFCQINKLMPSLPEIVYDLQR